MNRIVMYFMKRPVLFWSVMVGLVLAGIMTFLQMPKLEDPAVPVKQAMVIVPYPGASSHEVELHVAIPLEDELKALPNVKKITSQCENGMASITVEFVPEVQSKDLEQQFDLFRRKINDYSSHLPQGCYTPIIVDDMMDVYGMFYYVSAENYEPAELTKYTKMLRRELMKVKGVKRINIFGSQDEEIEIVISKDKITRNGIIPVQIMSALQSASETVDPGKYDIDDEKLQFRVKTRIKNEKDIENLTIQTLDGKHLRIGDIAEVHKGYASPQKNGFFVNGKPAIALMVAAESDANIPEIGKSVDKKIEELKGSLPTGFIVDKVFFQPDQVDDAINSFMMNLVESVLIVIIALILAMGWRSGVIIGIGLCLTIAGSFPILLACGTTLQRISLGAFIIAMGMLVDNAIVIMDGIIVDRNRGLAPKKYLFNIGKKTAFPLLGATIIAAASLLCIFLSKNTTGEYARDVFLVLAISLLLSWVLALVQVPIFAKTFLPVRIKRNTQGEIKDNKMQHAIRTCVQWLIAHRTLSVSVFCGVLLLSIFGMTKVKNLFFPDFNYNQYVIEYFLPPQTDPAKVKEDLISISDMLMKNGEVKSVAATMGGPAGRYSLVRPMTSGGDSYGEIIVTASDYNTVVKQVPLVREKLRALYPDAYIRLRKYNFSTSTSHSVEVAFSGPDPAVLKQLSLEAENAMCKSQYVDPYSVENNWKPTSKTIVADFSDRDALKAGLTRKDVANSISAATDGLIIGAINDADIPVTLRMKVRNSDGSRISDISTIPVWSSMNIKIDNADISSFLSGGKSAGDIEDRVFRSMPLCALSDDISVGWEESVVMRVNGERNIEAQCDPDFDQYDATPTKVEDDIRSDIEKIKLPKGYSMEWKGENANSSEAIGDLLKYLPITIFLIVLVLLMLFNNWRKVGLIMICFPFVLCGIVPALLVCRQPFTFMVVLGLFGLIGMMIKNAIVLVDEINRRTTEDKEEPYSAVVNATVSRTRPVVMASLTTIVGMIPLIGDPMYSSMAIAVIGGLTAGTIITLMLLPLLYTVFFKIKTPKEV